MLHPTASPRRHQRAPGLNGTPPTPQRQPRRCVVAAPGQSEAAIGHKKTQEAAKAIFLGLHPVEIQTPYHFERANRMPVMLSDNDALKWVRREEIDRAPRLVKPFSADLMEGYDVSKGVNNPQNDSLDRLTPVRYLRAHGKVLGRSEPK